MIESSVQLAPKLPGGNTDVAWAKFTNDRWYARILSWVSDMLTGEVAYQDSGSRQQCLMVCLVQEPTTLFLRLENVHSNSNKWHTEESQTRHHEHESPNSQPPGDEAHGSILVRKVWQL
ncbi:MAG: hypothetical protein U0790_01430 [Isosphaeraceae bacterium]